jgi:hypothetical protein
MGYGDHLEPVQTSLQSSFQPDLHPGNILVMHKGTLCFLDFGLMGSIMQRDIEMFGRLSVSVKDKDVRKIIRSLQQMSGDFDDWKGWGKEIINSQIQLSKRLLNLLFCSCGPHHQDTFH